MYGIKEIRDVLSSPPENVDIVEMLMGKDVLFKRTPYFYAETLRDIALINRYSFDINHKENNGKNALFYIKNKKVALKLIEMGADVFAKNKKEQNLLFHCPDNMIELFINSGLDVNSCDSEGKTPLFYANVRRTEKMIKSGADIHISDNFGNTALFFGSHLKKQCLIDNGAMINHINNLGCNALFNVEETDAAITLIQNGIDVNQISNAGKNALFVLREEVCRYLLESTKINVNHINERDEKATALFGSGLNKSKLLIEYGINVNVKNHKDKNAFFYTKKNKELIKLLIEHNCHVEEFLLSGKVNDQELIDLMYLQRSGQSREILKNKIMCENKDIVVQKRI